MFRPCLSAAPLASVGVLILLVSAGPAVADASRWQLRGGAAVLYSDSGLEVASQELGFGRAETGGGFGLGLGLEVQLSPRLGLELGVLRAELEIDPLPPGPVIAIFPPPPILVFDATDLSVTPLTLGLNIHFSPGRTLDVYAGPLLAYVAYGDLGVTVDVRNPVDDLFPSPRPAHVNLGIDDDFAWGAKLGADLRLGEGPWSAAVSAAYLGTGVEASGFRQLGSFDIDPMILSMGFGYRF